MQTETQIAAIAHTIQAAVAPVFLLGGVGAMLGVLTNRLSRIVDHARRLEAELMTAAVERHPGIKQTLSVLARRARLTHRAIALCIGCGLFIASVIIVLFIGAFSRWNLSALIAALFVLSITSLICGLLLFLREIQIATRNLRIGEMEPDQRPAPIVSVDGKPPV